ncbi:glycosyltransferase [Butyrivibrio sp. NC3005]|uniref:glycosyltransferase n=1 Tax=Butyrivibrio sp. NC3005 TaxID=1280685 RepID=UPI000418B6FC|nr:glycosyltransferase [Butyrivibrio sp. NC3005]
MQNEKISFVIPCYCSEKTLEAVIAEVEYTMENEIKQDFEIICVNDGSADDTWGVIRKLADTKDYVIGVNFAKNFGQHAAIMAGLSNTSGDIIVCLDDDGQTPANEVGKLLDAIRSGSDVVYARYSHKKHSIFRNMGSLMNEWMAKTMIGKPKDLYVSSYFAARRYVVDEMLKYKGSFPYVVGLVLRTTSNISNVDVNHRKREVGASGYTLKKLLNLWVNGFTAFSIKPLRVATFGGGVFAFLGFIYGIYTIIKKIVLGSVVQVGFSALMSVLVFSSGMLMLMVGMVGEYIGRSYILLNSSPQYVIRDVVTKSDK